MFNWLGITAHGGWFVFLPFAGCLSPDHRAWILSILAVPLFLGHLYLWDLRRRRRREEAG